MQIPIEVKDLSGLLRRRDTIVVEPFADPPNGATPRELAQLIALVVFESHDLDVRVRVDGPRLEVMTPHAIVVATLQSGAFDPQAVQETIAALGLQPLKTRADANAAAADTERVCMDCGQVFTASLQPYGRCVDCYEKFRDAAIASTARTSEPVEP